MERSSMEVSQQARDIFLTTLASIDIREVIKKRIRLEGQTLFIDREEIDLEGFKEIVVIGLGKASLAMGAAVEEVIGDRFSRGILVSDRRHEVNVKSEVIIAGHPFPDSNSLRAGQRIISAIRRCTDESLIFFLISGGGSALVESPLSPDVRLEDLQELNRLLVGCGASIKEINAIRKRVSRIKRGGLGYLSSRLRCVALLISDVNSGDILSLASNPLFPEPGGREETLSIIESYGLMDELPTSIRRILEQPGLQDGEEDWTWDDNRLSRLLLLDNHDAIKAAARIAEGFGYIVQLDFNNSEGHYEAVAENHIDRILELYSLHLRKPVCLISGGEVSCPVKGDGLGGRNQEFVLYSATRLAAIDLDHDIAVLSCGTDGVDGNSNAAGAVAGANLVCTVSNQGVDVTGFIRGSDSHSFFRQFGGVVFTGPTGNNVRDIRILLANPVSL